MEPELKNRNHKKNNSTASVSKKTFSQGKSAKSGLLKRFLDWIAKGASASNMGGISCPT
jgi:hypothetical protein